MPKTIRVSDDTHEALTKLSTTRDTMDDVIQRLIRDAGKGKLLPSELEKFKKELRGNKSDETEIGDILSTLRVVYYGQFFKASGNMLNGIRERFIKEEIHEGRLKDSCLQLSQYNLVILYKNDRFPTWQISTDKGITISRESVEELISKKREDFENKLAQFQEKVLSLFTMLLETKLSYRFRGSGALDFLTLPSPSINDITEEREKIIKIFDGIANALIELGIGDKIWDYYLSKDTISDYYYVVSPEIINALKEHLATRRGIGEGMKDQVLSEELRDVKTFRILKEWLYLSEGGKAFSSNLRKLLDDEGLQWEDLKKELLPFEDRGMVKCKSLEEEPPLVIKKKDEVLNEIRDSIINSLRR